jgi:TrmH family RNA methyltransferase
MKSIASRDNPGFKELRLLAKDSREQQRQRRAVIDGVHLVSEYRARVGLPELLAVSESGERHAEVQAVLAAHGGVETLRLRDALFAEISGTPNPVGVLATIVIPDEPTAPPTDSCVLLEGIQDAGNVGTILRTAAAAGVRDVLLGPGCAGAWTMRVLRAAQGAHFGLRIREHADLVAAVEQYPGIAVATVVDGGTSLYELDLRRAVAWIFGNEGAGVSPALAAAAGKCATVPMDSGSESLNVSAAAAICLFEAVRQRKLA